jgi:hypothetical protein
VQRIHGLLFAASTPLSKPGEHDDPAPRRLASPPIHFPAKWLETSQFSEEFNHPCKKTLDFPAIFTARPQVFPKSSTCSPYP